jgi:hypothetical protein
VAVIAKITFLKIPRPPHGYRYLDKGNWVRMYGEGISNVACMFGFLDDKEYYDGDTTEVELDFYDGEPSVDLLVPEYTFSFYILDLEIAKGVILHKSE